MTTRPSSPFVRSRLKMRQMALLVELARHGSILRAAEATNLTQSAASKVLTELEQALGVQLFERHARGVSPTPYGQVMIRRAVAALAELEAGHQELMELLSGVSGAVALGTVLTPSTRLVPEAVCRLRALHPRVRVSITVDTSKPLIQRLKTGELDLVIGRLLDGESAGELNFEVVVDEPHSVIVRAGHPLLSREGIGLEDLATQSWILPPGGSVLRDRLTALFLSRGLDQPGAAVETLALPVVSRLLLDTDMVAVLPEEVVRGEVDMNLLKILPFDLGLRMDAYGIVTRKGHQLSPAAAAMAAVLRELVHRRGE